MSDQNEMETLVGQTAYTAQAKDLAYRSVIMVPDNASLVDASHFSPCARRMAAAFCTPDPTAFVQYVNTFAMSEEAAVFIDPASMTARAVLDYGTPEHPGHKEHTAHYEAEPATELKTLKASLDSRGYLSFFQEDFIRFLESMEQQILFYGKGGRMEQPAAIQALRKLTLERARNVHHDVQEMARNVSDMERIALSGEAPLPMGFTLRTTVYEGLPTYQNIEMRIRPDFKESTDKSVVLCVDCPQWTIIKHRKAMEMRDLLQKELGEGAARVFIGSLGKPAR